MRGVHGQLWADGAAGLAERGGEERETDRGQDSDRHHACSAGTDAQAQKGAPQTSIALGKVFTMSLLSRWAGTWAC